jgi:hypothetical protein
MDNRFLILIVAFLVWCLALYYWSSNKPALFEVGYRVDKIMLNPKNKTSFSASGSREGAIITFGLTTMIVGFMLYLLVRYPPKKFTDLLYPSKKSK